MPAIPTVHLNGTSKESLIAMYDDAYAAVDAAYDVLKKSAPNGRDYYVQPGDALKVAASEHTARLRKMHDVMNELQAIVNGIVEQ